MPRYGRRCDCESPERAQELTGCQNRYALDAAVDRVSLTAPHGTPSEIIVKINQDLASALAESDVIGRSNGFGYEPTRVRLWRCPRTWRRIRSFSDISKRGAKISIE
jgi:hypothetical protein